MSDLDTHAAGKLATLEALATRRAMRVASRASYPTVEIDGRRLLSLSCNDVLGLSRHPDVIAAANDATTRWGTGAGASRLVTGNAPPIATLEADLARFKGTPAACVFGSGYLANLGVVGALVGAGDLVILDALSHNCLFAAARLSGAATAIFAHNDTDALAAILDARRRDYRHCLVATETVFSMDGDRAPLRAIGAIARDHGAWLLTDDAHGLGLLGRGRGGVHQADACDLVQLQLGTLSKAIGGYGGYLCASMPVIALMASRARTLVYSTGLPPSQAAAASAALRIIAADPDLVARPLAHARRFTARLGLPDAESHIVPILLGPAQAALEAAARLEQAGFLATAIRPPTVPEGTSRLRLSFPAALSDADVDRLADAIAAILPGHPRPLAPCPPS